MDNDSLVKTPSLISFSLQKLMSDKEGFNYVTPSKQ